MWVESYGDQISKILNLMAHPSNLRPHPEHSERMMFDGGEMSVMTGITRYEFSDGASAFFGTGPGWGLTITLASGDEFTIKGRMKNCGQCGGLLLLGDTFCRQCGQRTS